MPSPPTNPVDHAALDEDVHNANVRNISNAALVSAYFDWQLETFVPHLKGRVLEIGAGIGTISARLIHHAEQLVISDVSEDCLRIVRDSLSADGHSCAITYSRFALGTEPPEAYRQAPFDAIVCVNVLEHVEDDRRAVRYLQDAVKDQGKLLILVPAMPALYGTVDRALGHHRRYTRKSLTACLEAAGYRVELVKHINMLGVVGWWFNGRVLRRTTIPKSNFKVFKYVFPLVMACEAVITPPVGLSLVAVAGKA